MRVIKFACVLCLCIFITSCSSLFTTTVTYKAQAYTSCAPNFKIDKNGGMLATTIVSDSIARTILDKDIANLLTEKGFKTDAATDCIPFLIGKGKLTDSDLSELSKKTVSYIFENDCRYMLDIYFGDTYTYTTGGGIATLYFEAILYDRMVSSNTYQVMSISGFVDCNENKYQSYAESIEPACNAIAKAITEEFIKYVE